MHTISAEQLLESQTFTKEKLIYLVKDKDGAIVGCRTKPKPNNTFWEGANRFCFGHIAITDFQGKDWMECIYKAKPSEEDWVGTLCFFADSAFGLDDQRIREISVLSIIDKESKQPYLSVENDWWAHCRPVRPDEVEFFNDDTSEE